MSKVSEHDAEGVKEILEVVSEKIPALLNSLTDVLYGKDAAAKYGEAVSSFYKTLKGSGMTDEQAYRLTEQYMSSLNFMNILGSAMGSRGRRHEGAEDVAEEIREGIRSGLERRKESRDDER